MELVPGTMVTPQIRLERMLGEGGMGSVWVAEHQGLGTRVAVKFISEAVASKPEVRQRFTREARASARIKSPHVVQVFDTGLLDERVPFIVMELLEGRDLGQHIKRVGRLPIFEVVNVIRQACKALAKAHDAGVVHRDIKPDNLFICDPDGDAHVKVLDFGVAKSDDSDLAMTSTGAIVGTPYYMSPEQLLSAKHVDLRSDLWSLAVVAYHALSGQRPFEAETFPGLVVAIERGYYPLPFERLGIGTPEIDAWVSRALNRDIEQRFTSAAEMASALEDAAGVPRAPQASLSQISAPDHDAPVPPMAATRLDTAAKTHSALASSVTTTVGGPPLRSNRGLIIGVAVAGVALASGALWLGLRGQPVAAEPAPASVASAGGDVPASAAPSDVASAVVPEVTPSTDPQGKAKLEPEVKPEQRPEPKPETKPQAKPEPKPEPKPAAEPKPEPKPAAEPKPEPKPAAEPKPDDYGF